MRLAPLFRHCWLAFVVGCALGRSAPVLPGGSSLVRDQLVVYSDFKLPRKHRLLDELTALRGDISSKLGLPVSDEPIHVYLFDAAGDFQAYVDEHFPEFPERRAFFVESDTRLCVYAYWGDRVAEDLRHEVVHGYLHAVVPRMPLWVDEGIAEYFEVPRGRNGLNRPHVALLTQRRSEGKWSPDLKRLESISSVADMTQRDYAEAWLWTHMLLETTPQRRQVLHRYLDQVRQEAQAPPLSSTFEGEMADPNGTLVEYLQGLASNLNEG